MGKLILLVAVVMAVVLVVAVLRRAGSGGASDASRAELERMTHDRAVADRLVERMRARHPDASEARLIRLAIAELRADRRR